MVTVLTNKSRRGVRKSDSLVLDVELGGFREGFADSGMIATFGRE